MIAFQPLH